MSEAQPPSKQTIGILLFEGFEVLDVFGPAEVFGVLPTHFWLEMIAQTTGPIASSQGPLVVATRSLGDPGLLDVTLVPGGAGTRREVANLQLLEGLRSIATTTWWVASVCTGSALLARAVLLDGREATSSKPAFDWVVSQAPAVRWRRKARWVRDGRYWTSSGVAAGIDMSLAFLEHLLGPETAKAVAHGIEYGPHRDADRDPFAEPYDTHRTRAEDLVSRTPLEHRQDHPQTLPDDHPRSGRPDLP